MDAYLILTGTTDGKNLGDAGVKVLGAWGVPPELSYMFLDGEACVVRVRVVETLASQSPAGA